MSALRRILVLAASWTTDGCLCRSASRVTRNVDRNTGSGSFMPACMSAALAASVSPWFLVLTAFVGANQLLYVAAGDCPASLILKRACGLRPAGGR